MSKERAEDDRLIFETERSSNPIPTRSEKVALDQPLDRFLDSVEARRVGEASVARRAEGASRNRGDVGLVQSVLDTTLIVVVDRCGIM